MDATLAAIASWAPVTRRVPQIVWLAGLSVFGLLGYAAPLAGVGAQDAAVATVLAAGVAGFVSGIAGFAFSAICGAILFRFQLRPGAGAVAPVSRG